MDRPHLATRRLLRIFLASPGDLSDERKAAKDVVDDLNRGVCRQLNMAIDLLGWEDTLLGLGRPQSLINQDLDTCDLFVGMLWHRWGTPTGTHTSGFEEEFYRARDRSLNGGIPELWLYFKAIEESAALDPGPALAQVLAFQRALEESRQVFFNRFGNCSDWQRTFGSQLSTYVVKLALEERAEKTSADEHLLARSDVAVRQDVSSASPEGAPSPALLEVTRNWLIASGAIRPDEWVDAFLGLPEASAAQMLISTKAWTSLLYTHDFLGPHDANFIFANRAGCNLLTPEWRFAFYSVLASPARLIPGWYWLRQMDEGALAQEIRSALAESSVEVRRGATRLVTELPGNPILPLVSDLIADLLNDEDEDIRSNARDALVELSSPTALAKLESADAKLGGGDPALYNARALVALSLAPAEAFARMIADGKAISSHVRDRALASAEQIPSSIVSPALTAPEPRLRYLAAMLLYKRDELDKASARGLLADTSFGIRRVGLLALIQRGARPTLNDVLSVLDESKAPNEGLRGSLFSDESERGHRDSVLVALMATWDKAALEEAIDYYSPAGPIAYGVLVRKYFSDVALRLRSDLTEMFATLKQQSEDRLRSSFGAGAESLIKAYGNYSEHFRLRFVEAALAALAEHAAPDDAVFARAAIASTDGLSSHRVDNYAIKILSKVNSSQDVQALITFAMAADGPPWWVQIEAAKSALVLSGFLEEVALKLLESPREAVVRIVLDLAYSSGRLDLSTKARHLLLDDRPEMRKVFAAYVAITCIPAALEAEIDEYMKAAPYFYDVVCILERAAYAPQPLRQSVVAYFRKALEMESTTLLFGE